MTNGTFVEDFLKTLTLDILDADNFINWSEINKTIIELTPGIKSLESLNKESKTDFNSGLITILTSNQTSALKILKLLIGHSPDILSLPDGRQIDFNKRQDAEIAAKIFVDLGIFELLQKTKSIEDILKGVLIGLYPNTRKNIRGDVFEKKIKSMIKSVIIEMSKESGQNIILREKVPITLANEIKNVDYALFLNNNPKPFSVLETNFYSTSGSKPSETITRAYPDLQNELGKIGASLIVISDGQGWYKMKNVLLAASQKLKYFYNYRQAEKYALKSAILSMIASKGVFNG